MAKVMVSLPDDLLHAVDVEAQRRGTTRSGYLRELAEESMQRRCLRRAERMAEIDAEAPTVGHGGHGAEVVKATRPLPLRLYFLDASVLLAAEDSEDTLHLAARELLLGADPLATLDLAYYEVANVAVRSWRDLEAGKRLRARVAALANDGGIVRVDPGLLESATLLADDEGISVYDAAYVAASRKAEAQLVSCDERDLVARGLACSPAARSDDDRR